MLTEWALLGQGIALKPVFEVAAHLRAGRLVPVLPDFPPEPVTLAVVYPHRKLLPAKVKAFADFMVEEVGKAVGGRRAHPWPSRSHRLVTILIPHCSIARSRHTTFREPLLTRCLGYAKLRRNDMSRRRRWAPGLAEGKEADA